MYREIKQKNNSRHMSFEINQHLTIKKNFDPSPIADDIVIFIIDVTSRCKIIVYSHGY